VPNDNYCSFEDWITPIFDEMYEEQVNKKTVWSPSKMIRKMGEKINNPESVYYWAAKNDIPVFCPAITDGSIGDMLFFYSYKKENFVIDVVDDIRSLNKLALKAKKTGVVILGGGVVKHHILNANLMRNGADFAVFVNTGMDYDGSDAGATPGEAVSWGKLKVTGSYVKVFAEATLVFPIIVAESFAKYYFEKVKKNVENKQNNVKSENGGNALNGNEKTSELSVIDKNNEFGNGNKMKESNKVSDHEKKSDIGEKVKEPNVDEKVL